MKKKNYIIFSVIVILSLLLILFVQRQFSHERRIYSNMDTICFEKDVLPIFIKNCAVSGCHDQQTRTAGYYFVNYNSIIKGVIPFKPEKSIVYKSLHGNEASPMPPGQELTESQKLLITVWIGQGAKNIVCQ